MEVTFRRTAQRRYAVVVNRPGAPALVMHPAPGYDPLVPHDLAHFIVERECGHRGETSRRGGPIRR